MGMDATPLPAASSVITVTAKLTDRRYSPQALSMLQKEDDDEDAVDAAQSATTAPKKKARKVSKGKTAAAAGGSGNSDDALTLDEMRAKYQHLADVPAISLPNGCNSLPPELLQLLERFEKIYLWMDNDKAGQVRNNAPRAVRQSSLGESPRVEICFQKGIACPYYLSLYTPTSLPPDAFLNLSSFRTRRTNSLASWA
jgi:Toprim-like